MFETIPLRCYLCSGMHVRVHCIVVSFIDCDEQNIVHQVRTVFGRHHSGYVFPMLLCVKPMESTTEFVGMVKKLNGDDDFFFFFFFYIIAFVP